MKWLIYCLTVTKAFFGACTSVDGKYAWVIGLTIVKRNRLSDNSSHCVGEGYLFLCLVIVTEDSLASSYYRFLQCDAQMGVT